MNVGLSLGNPKAIIVITVEMLTRPMSRLHTTPDKETEVQRDDGRPYPIAHSGQDSNPDSVPIA